MGSPKSENEKTKSSRESSQRTGEALSSLRSLTSLSWLETEIQKWINSRRKPKNENSESKEWNTKVGKWRFEYKNESKDKEYYVYLYTVKSWWKPKNIRRQAVKQKVSNTKDWILITNKKWVIYNENHRFSAWDSVYVKIPKAIGKRATWGTESSRSESDSHPRNRTESWRSKLDSTESKNKQVVNEQWMYDKCIEYWVSDKRQIAYILATAKREAPNPNGSWFKNREEIWRWKNKRYWKKDSTTWHAYYGRWFVQLTWKKNYTKMTEKIRLSWKSFKCNDGSLLKWSEIDLVNNPDLILKSNELAACTTIYWMKYWIFTWVKLDTYINDNKTDFRNARKIVNGLDHADEIAANAKKYLRILES